MHTSRRASPTGVGFTGTAQPAQPVVHILTDDGSEREMLEDAISSAGFLPQPLASAGMFATSPAIVGPTCLVLNGIMLPPLVPPERLAMPIICLAAEG